VEESQEAAEGRGCRAGLQESLVVVAAVVQGSPEGEGEMVRLGNLEVVVGPLPRLEGNQAGVAVPKGVDVVVRLLHDRLISGYVSPWSDVERTCAPRRRTLRHGNVVVCIFLLLFFGHAWGRGLRHRNIVVCVLCVDAISQSGVYQNDQQPTFFFLSWPARRDSTLGWPTIFWLSPRTINKLALLWMLFNVFLLLLDDIVEFHLEVLEPLLVRFRK